MASGGQTSNFTVIYKLITEADPTELLKTSKTLEDFAKKTTASTGLVQELTNVTSAGINYISDYFGAYQKGFESISGRFDKISKEGAGFVNVARAIGGTALDTVNVKLAQMGAGAELVGSLLNSTLVRGFLGMAAAATAGVAVLVTFGAALTDIVTASIQTAANVKSVDAALGTMRGSAKNSVSDLLAAADALRKLQNSAPEFIKLMQNIANTAGIVWSGVKNLVATTAGSIGSLLGTTGDLNDKWSQAIEGYAKTTVAASRSFADVELITAKMDKIGDSDTLARMFQELALISNTDMGGLIEQFKAMSTATGDQEKSFRSIAAAAVTAANLGGKGFSEWSVVLSKHAMGIRATDAEYRAIGVTVDGLRGEFKDLGKLMQDVDAQRTKLAGAKVPRLDTGAEGQLGVLRDQAARQERIGQMTLEKRVEFSRKEKELALKQAKDIEDVMIRDMRAQQALAERNNSLLITGARIRTAAIENIEGRSIKTMMAVREAELTAAKNAIKVYGLNADQVTDALNNAKLANESTYAAGKAAAKSLFDTASSGIADINKLLKDTPSNVLQDTFEIDSRNLRVIGDQLRFLEQYYQGVDESSVDYLNKLQAQNALYKQGQDILRGQTALISEQVTLYSDLAASANAAINTSSSSESLAVEKELFQVRQAQYEAAISQAATVQDRTKLEIQQKKDLIESTTKLANVYREFGRIGISAAVEDTATIQTRLISSEKLLDRLAKGQASLNNNTQYQQDIVRGAGSSGVAGAAVSLQFAKDLQAFEEKFAEQVAAVKSAADSGDPRLIAAAQQELVSAMRGQPGELISALDQKLGADVAARGGRALGVDTLGVQPVDLKRTAEDSLKTAKELFEQFKGISAVIRGIGDTIAGNNEEQQKVAELIKENSAKALENLRAARETGDAEITAEAEAAYERAKKFEENFVVANKGSWGDKYTELTDQTINKLAEKFREVLSMVQNTPGLRYEWYGTPKQVKYTEDELTTVANEMDKMSPEALKAMGF